MASSMTSNPFRASTRGGLSGRRGAIGRLLAAFAVLMSCSGQVSAEISGAWTLNGASSADTSAGLNGITVNVSGTTGATAYVNGALQAAPAAYWTTTYSGAVPGNPSLQMTLEFPATTTVRTITMTFSEPVDNPILHLDRFGGVVGGTSNSSVWTLSSFVAQTGGVTLERLSGNTQFELAGSTFRRNPNQAGTVTNAECTTLATGGTGCGSIRFNGIGITSLTFSIAVAGPLGNDAIELAWSFTGSKVQYRKQSIGGTGSFSLSGTNGVGSSTLSTVVTNPSATSAQYTVADHTQAITITEPTVPPGYVLSTASSCVDQNNAPVASSVNVATRTLTIAAASYGGNQTITCTMVNTLPATVTVTKVSNGGVGTFAFSGNNGFAAQNITTTTPGTGVSGATQALTTPSTATRITEAAPPTGFVLSAISCTGLGAGGTATPTINGSGGGFVDLSAQATAPGSNIACTFTNNALGSITIVKDAQPDNAQDFAFVSAESPLLNFSLDDDADAALPNSRTITNLSNGTYTVTESLTPGWTLASITCVDPDSGTLTNLLARSAVIDLDPGENVTCTYVNGATGIADVQVAKTNNNTAPLVAGGTTTYVLTVTNNGPASVNGAVVRDTPGSGLNCPPANPVTCSPAAACPAGTNVGNLTSTSGVTLGNIANGGVVTLTFTCNVQ